MSEYEWKMRPRRMNKEGRKGEGRECEGKRNEGR